MKLRQNNIVTHKAGQSLVLQDCCVDGPVSPSHDDVLTTLLSSSRIQTKGRVWIPLNINILNCYIVIQ